MVAAEVSRLLRRTQARRFAHFDADLGQRLDDETLAADQLALLSGAGVLIHLEEVDRRDRPLIAWTKFQAIAWRSFAPSCRFPIQAPGPASWRRYFDTGFTRSPTAPPLVQMSNSSAPRSTATTPQSKIDRSFLGDSNASRNGWGCFRPPTMTPALLPPPGSSSTTVMFFQTMLLLFCTFA